MREWFEYAAVWCIVKFVGALPRAAARALAVTVASALYAMRPKLRRTAEFNLRLAFPDWNDAQRRSVLRAMVRNLGWMAAEFARFPKYTSQTIEQVLILDGHESHHSIEFERYCEENKIIRLCMPPHSSHLL